MTGTKHGPDWLRRQTAEQVAMLRAGRTLPDEGLIAIESIAAESPELSARLLTEIALYASSNPNHPQDLPRRRRREES